jgi:anti-sigma regulatory factor (Ser/Thr protein kinase)
MWRRLRTKRSGDSFTVRDEQDVSEARQFVFDRCEASGLHDVCHDAALLASEVVTNAIRYAPSDEITVRAERDGDDLVVQVFDASVTHPTVLATDPLADHGRGMALVDAIAREWGVAPHPAGKVVWFRL